MPKFINKEMKKQILGLYSKESGIPIDDPQFMQKLSKWRDKKYGEDLKSKSEICPHCGHEM